MSLSMRPENRRQTGARRAAAQWFLSGMGSAIAAAENGEIGVLLSTFRGHTHLHLGMGLGGENTALIRLFQDSSLVQTHPDTLPFGSESMAVVILQHVLEFTGQPHAVLREAERVLSPEGHLVIFGFNPWSIWGLGRLIHRRGIPWCGQFYSAARLRDWLALLGLETLQVRRCAAHAAVGEWRANWPWPARPTWGKLGVAGVYFLVARKRVLPLTPLRPTWTRSQRRWPLVPGGVASGRICNEE